LFSNGFGRRETKALIAGQRLQEICAEALRALLQVEPVLVAHWFLFAGLIWPFPPVIEQQARTACSGLSLTRVITGLNFFVIGINQSPPWLVKREKSAHFQDVIARCGKPHVALLRLH
jgi:hypothetical protein